MQKNESSSYAVCPHRTCAVPFCDAQIPYRFLLCQRHLEWLPEELQQRIKASSRSSNISGSGGDGVYPDDTKKKLLAEAIAIIESDPVPSRRIRGRRRRRE